jgi:hypothetical protein
MRKPKTENGNFCCLHYDPSSVDSPRQRRGKARELKDLNFGL